MKHRTVRLKDMLHTWGVVFLASAVPLVAIVQRTSTFPADWQANNSRWFASYDESSDSIWAYTFDGDSIRLEPEGGSLAIKYECIDIIKKESHVYYMRNIGRSYDCVQDTSTTGAILQRTREIAVALNSSAICPFAVTGSTLGTWLIKLPFNDKTDKESPIPSLSYQATYSTSAGDVNCTGDNSSVAVVEGNKIKLTTCFTGITSYVKPLNTTLTVMAAVSGSSLDSAANGDILLLADFTTAGPTRFYCARFKVTGSLVELSLDVTGKNTVKCNKSQTYASVEANTFVAFAFTLQIGDADTNQCESGPCQNGATCEVVAGAYRCHCPQNYLGDNCETSVDTSSSGGLVFVILLIALAVTIVVCIGSAVIVCQYRNRTQINMIEEDKLSMSYFGFTSAGEREGNT